MNRDSVFCYVDFFEMAFFLEMSLNFAATLLTGNASNVSNNKKSRPKRLKGTLLLLDVLLFDVLRQTGVRSVSKCRVQDSF